MERAEASHGGTSSGGGGSSSAGSGAASGSGSGAPQPPYVTLIPVEYPRRTYAAHQSDYQYAEYRSREEYYGGQTQNLQADNGAHLYSVSQRLPPAPPYSPLGRHDDWGSQRQLPADGKENSLESLEKQSAAGSNSSSCSNQASGSNGTASTVRLDAQVPSSSSSASSAASPPLSGNNISLTPVCVYLMSRVAIQMDMEDPIGCTVQYMMRNIITCEEMGFNQPCKSLVPSVYSIWMISPLLELQLKNSHKPWDVRRSWKNLIKKYSHGTPNQQMRDEPIIRFQRNVFYPRHEEEKIKEGRIIELLYEEAREHVIKGRYPCGSARAVALGALQARIQLGPYDPLVHTTHFFRQRQKEFLPAHLRLGWLWMGARSSKAGAEARLLEQFRRAPAAAPPRKLMRKYLELCWPLPFYGAAFFQGQVEQPVRGLTSLITHEDIAVLVAINATGIYVIDECECTMLLGLRYEELSWECARPSNETNEDCLPCLFLQFMVVENGLRVTKILQVFSKQVPLMEPLIVHFVGEFKKRLASEEGQRAESPQQYDYQHSPVGVEGGGDMDSPARRLANKTARLSLATFDERGVALGHAGSWRLAY